jgi:diadenosine tetraphosphatase ApaH/serine/threonine PP2A family protein phosphatase
VRCLIATDIHSNIEALEAVLEDASGLGCDTYLCLGDIVGYGASPRETLAAVRDRFDVVVRGNHDAALIDEAESFSFNECARAAIEWTRGELGTDERDYIASLPLAEHIDGVRLVHGSPEDPAGWHYVKDTMGASYQFEAFEEQFCLIGHTHLPLVVSLAGGTLRAETESQIRLRPNIRYLINVGSVGQPRDGDPDAAYGVLDLEAGSLELRRVKYRVKRARRKILDAGLPEFLGERLLTGA